MLHGLATLEHGIVWHTTGASKVRMGWVDIWQCQPLEKGAPSSSPSPPPTPPPPFPPSPLSPPLPHLPPPPPLRPPLSPTTPHSHSDLSYNYFTGAIVKPVNVLAVLSFNYLSGTLPQQQQTDLLDANCFKLAQGETKPVQRPQSACQAFCGISIGKAVSNGFAFVISATKTAGRSDGVGYGGMNDRSMAIEFDVLQTKAHEDMKEQHVGLNIQGQDKSIATAKSPFPLANKQAYTAWVDYAPGDPGTIQVFLGKTAVKPEKPLLDRRLSLCAVLKPGPPQGEGMQQQPRAFYFGFVASTTVKPFMVHTILRSALRTAYGLNLSLNTFVPARASPFSRYVSADYQVSAGQKDSWAFRDFHSWDSVPFLGWPIKDQGNCNASWAFAVVSSIEAAYGIATNLEAPQLSVDSLFTAMNLTTLAAKCTTGGSPTDAFEKLVALPGAAITMEGNKGFERTSFKGYVGLMMAVQRQPLVVHIEASVASFVKYDGVSVGWDE
ncbi:unnamed protein product [Closterium sp. NIES-65]|nr:unnamed protein product [Closterium sp. NIES-65]